MIHEESIIDNNIHSSSNLHDLEFFKTTNKKSLLNKNSFLQKFVAKNPILQNVTQKIGSRSANSKLMHVPDLNFPKKREIIINNIKTTIPKVNNFIGRPSFSTNKENTEVKMLHNSKPKKKLKYFKLCF